MTQLGSRKHSADGWVLCGCGHKHWGKRGAAGVLVFSPDLSRVLLQHRALWSHHGGTWGVPGGAVALEETSLQAALREAEEEAGVRANLLRVVASHSLLHPDWSYTTVIARAKQKFTAEATDAESLDIVWQPLETLGSLNLLPAFRASLPKLVEILYTSM